MKQEMSIDYLIKNYYISIVINQPMLRHIFSSEARKQRKREKKELSWSFLHAWIGMQMFILISFVIPLDWWMRMRGRLKHFIILPLQWKNTIKFKPIKDRDGMQNSVLLCKLKHDNIKFCLCSILQTNLAYIASTSASFLLVQSIHSCMQKIKRAEKMMICWEEFLLSERNKQQWINL